MNYKKNITSLLLAIISTFSILIELDKAKIISISKTISLTTFIIGVFLYFLYKKYKSDEYLGFKILSLLFSIFMVLGYSFEKLNSWYFVFGSIEFIIISIIKTIGYYFLFKVSIHKLYEVIKNSNVRNIKHKIYDKFMKRPILYSTLIILLCWMPYIISFYPTIMSPDPTNQVKSFFGIETRYIDGVNLVDEDVLITNDNPIIHTVLLGVSVKIGKLIGNDNVGFFIYSIVQITLLLTALLYSIKYLIKFKVPNIFILITLLIYSLVPLFPLYAMSAVKDVIFSAMMLIYIIKLFDLIHYNNFNKKDYIFLFIISLLVCLTRNNGIYHILLSLPFALIFLKNSRKSILLVSLLVFISYSVFLNVLLPSFKITPGNKREMFSIPFQQTARYVKYYGDELSESEINIIDTVLEYDTLSDRYSPEKADTVKNKFNALSTDEEFNEYLKLWFKLLLKRPGVYIEATMNNIFGFFYPNTSKWYVYSNEYKVRLNETGEFDYHYNNLTMPREVLSTYGEAFPYIPVIGLYANIGFMVWVHLFMLVFLIKEKLKKYIVFLLPALTIILVCVAGPVNTYFRYTLPYVIAFPATASLIYTVYKSKQNK